MNKLTDENFAWHRDQPDVPQKTAAEMKAFLDAPSRTLMEKVNELIEELDGRQNELAEHITALAAEIAARIEGDRQLSEQLLEKDDALKMAINDARNDLEYSLSVERTLREGEDEMLGAALTSAKDHIASMQNELSTAAVNAEQAMSTAEAIRDGKQDKLTAGEGIVLNEEFISVARADGDHYGTVRVGGGTGSDQVDGGYGIRSLSGKLAIFEASDTSIANKASTFRPITPAHLDYAVKVGLTNNAIKLTEAEKKAVRAWLGIDETPVKPITIGGLSELAALETNRFYSLKSDADLEHGDAPIHLNAGALITVVNGEFGYTVYHITDAGRTMTLMRAENGDWTL